MNLERGMSIPLEKEVKNGDIWVPPTPEKPGVRRSSYVSAEMQQNLMGAESWSDLLGFYTGLLQDESSNQLPPGFNPCSHVGLNRGELGQNVPPMESCNGLPPNLNATSFIDMNRVELVRMLNADTEEYPTIASEYKIEALPTFILFVDGKPYDRFEGAMAAQKLIERIETSLQVKQ